MNIIVLFGAKWQWNECSRYVAHQSHCTYMNEKFSFYHKELSEELDTIYMTGDIPIHF